MMKKYRHLLFCFSMCIGISSAKTIDLSELEELLLNGIDPVTRGYTSEQARAAWAEIVSKQNIDEKVMTHIEKSEKLEGW